MNLRVSELIIQATLSICPIREFNNIFAVKRKTANEKYSDDKIINNKMYKNSICKNVLYPGCKPVIRKFLKYKYA